jgi:hypothetical protein
LTLDEHQLTIERLMTKLKHDSLVPGGFVRYASSEVQPEDDTEDLRFWGLKWMRMKQDRREYLRHYMRMKRAKERLRHIKTTSNVTRVRSIVAGIGVLMV